jgi:quinol monooxygenase YgiN
MSKGVIHVQWYATVFQGDIFVDAINEQAAPLALEYGATKYSVMRSKDDPYRMTQLAWFESHDDWYRYWEGPEMREFRAYWSGRYQAPITYVWFDEVVSGEAAPAVATEVVVAAVVVE